MRRLACSAVILLGLVAGTPPVSAQSVEPVPPPLDDHAMLRKYVWSTLGPTGLVSSALMAGFDQWRGSPASWPGDEWGYARRWASEYGAAAIGSTTKYTVAHFLHQDPSFVRCECRGAGPRLRHAMAAPFMARTADDVWVFSPATVAGLAAENVIPAATWYPEPRGIRDGAAHVLTGVMSKMAVDVIREFMPKRLARETRRRTS
jgi:hypothetical protein